MADFFAGILGALVRPKPVHSIPGRMRMHLPGLKHVASFESDALPLITELTGLVPGVESIEPSFISGNILIHYAPEIVSESQLLHLIGAFARCAIRYRAQFLSVPTKKRNEVMEAIKDYIKNGALEALLSGKELDFPNAVWQ